VFGLPTNVPPRPVGLRRSIGLKGIAFLETRLRRQPCLAGFRGRFQDGIPEVVATAPTQELRARSAQMKKHIVRRDRAAIDLEDFL